MREISGRQFYDSLGEIVNPKHTAIIVVDVQNDFCSPKGHFAKHGADLSMAAGMLPNLQRLIEGGRKAGVMVVFIKNTRLVDGVSDAPAVLYFSVKRGIPPEYCTEGTWGHELVDGLVALPKDPIIRKHRASGFMNTDLDSILRANKIESLVVTGVVTHGCVLATALHGAYLDYYVVVASDCVASPSRELHEAGLKVMANRVDVLPSTEIIKEWATSK